MSPASTTLGQAAGERPAGRHALFNLANLVTLTRLGAVPSIVWLLGAGRYPAAFVLFVAAGLSDALDGWLARRYGGTAIGAALDPLADKALLAVLYPALALADLLPVWIAVLVVLRDLVMLASFMLLWVMNRAVAIRPLAVSKLNTALQIALAALVLGLAAFGIASQPLVFASCCLVGATTLVSAAAYAVRPLPEAR